MDYKRATWLTIVMYLASFFIGLFAAPYFGYDYNTPRTPVEIFLFGLITTIFLMIVFTKWYFSPAKIKASLYEGLQFGFFVVVVSFLLDFAIILPTLMSSEVIVDPIAYYTHPLFWVTVVSIPITAAVTGSYLSKPKEMPAKKKKTTKRKKSTSKKKKK